MKLLHRIIQGIPRTDRLTYQRNVALLTLAKMAVDLAAMVHVPGTDPALVALTWADPFTAFGALPMAIRLSTLGFLAGLLWNSVRRLRDTGLTLWGAWFTAVPYLNTLAALVLALLPSRRRTVWDLV